MKLFAALCALLLLLSGCAAKKPPTAQPPPPPPEIQKPKPRPIKSGDMILKLPDGSSLICHRPIQVIDSKRPHEDVTVYQCR